MSELRRTPTLSEAGYPPPFPPSLLPSANFRLDPTRERLLIIDGHASHLSFPFFEFAVDHNITLLRMPAHTSHLLQPLDVSVFSPLKKALNDEFATASHIGQKVNKLTFGP